MVIRQVFFSHKGGKYVYRLHNEKIIRLCNGQLGNLKNYLCEMETSCPNHYFNGGPRGSTLKFNLIDNIVPVNGHEVSLLAGLGLEVNKERYKDNHSKVQAFMLENDETTLAMEVPIWLNPTELHGYKTIFRQDGILTGHIDVLRIEDGNIWIWDYKPNANREKYASTQIFFYALMLSKRSGIPLERFRCGYFDQNYAFMFKPGEEFLLKLNKQTLLKE